LERLIKVEVDADQCRSFSNRGTGQAFLYVPAALLTEENSRVLTVVTGFTVQRRVARVVWAYKYALYRVDVGSFPDGAKAALATAIMDAAKDTCVRVVYRDTIGNSHWGLVTVMSDDKVSLLLCVRPIFVRIPW